MADSNTRSPVVYEAADRFRMTVLRDVLRLGPGLISQLIGGFAVSLVLGRYLSGAEMGRFTLFWVTQSYLAILGAGWVQHSAVRFLPGNRTQLPTMLRLALEAVAGVFIVSSFLGLAVAYIFGGGVPAVQVMLAAVVAAEVAAYGTLNSILRGLFDHWRYSTAAFGLSLMQVLLLTVVLSHSSATATAALFSLAVSYLPALAWQLYGLLFNLRQLRSASTSDRPTLIARREAFRYGVPLALSLLTMTILQTGDRYLIVKLTSVQQVGVYAFWMTLGLQAGRGAYNLIFAVLNPRLFQVHAASPETAVRYASRLAGVYLLLFAPTFALVGCLMVPMLRLLGVKALYLDSGHLIFFGLGSALLLGLAQLCAKPKEFAQQTSFLFGAAVGALCVMMIGVFVLVPRIGLTGAAFSTFLGFVFYFLMTAAAAASWPPAKQSLAASMSAGAVVAVYVLLIRSYDPIKSVTAVIGLVVLAFGLTVTGLRTFADRSVNAGS